MCEKANFFESKSSIFLNPRVSLSFEFSMTRGFLESFALRSIGRCISGGKSRGGSHFLVCAFRRLGDLKRDRYFLPGENGGREKKVV